MSACPCSSIAPTYPLYRDVLHIVPTCPYYWSEAKVRYAMKTLRCDNCNTRFNVHDDCLVIRCPGCRCEVEAREGTPPTDASTPWQPRSKYSKDNVSIANNG